MLCFPWPVSRAAEACRVCQVLVRGGHWDTCVAVSQIWFTLETPWTQVNGRCVFVPDDAESKDNCTCADTQTQRVKLYLALEKEANLLEKKWQRRLCRLQPDRVAGNQKALFVIKLCIEIDFLVKICCVTRIWKRHARRLFVQLWLSVRIFS